MTRATLTVHISEEGIRHGLRQTSDQDTVARSLKRAYGLRVLALPDAIYILPRRWFHRRYRHAIDLGREALAIYTMPAEIGAKVERWHRGTPLRKPFTFEARRIDARGMQQ